MTPSPNTSWPPTSPPSAHVVSASAENVDPLEDLRAGYELQIDFGLANPALFRLFSDPARGVNSPAVQAGRAFLCRAYTESPRSAAYGSAKNTPLQSCMPPGLAPFRRSWSSRPSSATLNWSRPCTKPRFGRSSPTPHPPPKTAYSQPLSPYGRSLLSSTYSLMLSASSWASGSTGRSRALPVASLPAVSRTPAHPHQPARS